MIFDLGPFGAPLGSIDPPKPPPQTFNASDMGTGRVRFTEAELAHFVNRVPEG